MELSDLCAQGHAALQQALGYLNFAAGAPDPKFLQNLNELYGLVSDDSQDQPASTSSAGRSPREPNWRVLGHLFGEKLRQLASDTPTFADSQQVSAVLQLVLQQVIPGYRKFHQDLLLHQTDNLLLNSFMFGRVCEAVLSQGPPWDETDRITSDSLAMLNDYVGHRPVAALETRKIEPSRTSGHVRSHCTSRVRAWRSVRIAS